MVGIFAMEQEMEYQDRIAFNFLDVVQPEIKDM